MELRTYTNLWNVEKKLYTIGDFKLPVAIGVKQLIAVMLTGIPWMIFLSSIHFPFKSPFHVVWFAVPVGIAYFAGKPVKEGKRLGDLLRCQIVYLMQNREYARLCPAISPLTTTVSSRVWVPNLAVAPDKHPHEATPASLPTPVLVTRKAA